MGFGDIFASGSSNPYELLGEQQAEDQTRATRMKVAQAFADWRHNNPEASMADLQSFMSMASGGDPNMVPQLNDPTFIKNFQQKSDEAKAKRILAEQQKKVAEDMQWQTAIQERFAKNLDAYHYDTDAAWNQTQSQVLGGVTDPKAQEVFKRRLSSFDPKSYANSLSRQFISSNLSSLQTIATNAYLNGDDDKSVMGKLSAWSGRPLDPNDQVFGLVLGEAKRTAQQKKADQDWVTTQRKDTETQFAQQQKDRAEQRAKDAATLLMGGARPDQVKQFYPDVDPAQVQAVQRSLYDVGKEKVLAGVQAATEKAQKDELSKYDFEGLKKGALKNNPLAQIALEQTAQTYQLTDQQRAAAISAAADPHMKGKSLPDIQKAISDAVVGTKQGPLRTHVDAVRSSLLSQYDRHSPKGWSETLSGMDKQVGDKVSTLSKMVSDAANLPDDQKITTLANARKAATQMLQGIDLAYSSDNLQPTLYGEYRDEAGAQTSAGRAKEQVQAILTQIDQQIAAASAPHTGKGKSDKAGQPTGRLPSGAKGGWGDLPEVGSAIGDAASWLGGVASDAASTYNDAQAGTITGKPGVTPPPGGLPNVLDAIGDVRARAIAANRERDAKIAVLLHQRKLAQQAHNYGLVEQLNRQLAALQ